ncbi:hypothetical protein [Streptomyces sp. NPDC000618]|uniref:hypothetical protein n=1 Tax=Streptomyces sp. NPDC000618 TaxID=3154265 RepID=UPI0033217A88
MYWARSDVTAVARTQPEAVLAAGAVTDRISLLHGQTARLGASIPVHDEARLLRSADRAEHAARTLGEADALVLRGNGPSPPGARPGTPWPACGCSTPRAGYTSPRTAPVRCSR